jgi:hypothetical protein
MLQSEMRKPSIQLKQFTNGVPQTEVKIASLEMWTCIQGTPWVSTKSQVPPAAF